MKKTVLRKYAKLIACVGANVQKGQGVLLRASVEQHDFAVMVAEECYRLGAAWVMTDWICSPIDKLNYRWMSLKNLSTIPQYLVEKFKYISEKLPARIFIASDDPDGMKGVNLEKMQKARMATYPVIKPYLDAMESRHQWTIAAAAGEAWAKKVFPDLKKSQAVEKLWESILAAVRVSADPDNDPVAEWAKHNENFRKRCAWLNSQKFDYLTYKSSNGTDFKCWLMPESVWCGGGEKTLDGTFFNPNLPTEEIFTSPKAGMAEGTLVSTKPLSWNGVMIENFSIRFEDGRAVEWHAEKGEEALTRMIGLDEGAAKLGELALIPTSSPICQSGILYYETLFDENASCHVALGRGFFECVEGYTEKTHEECFALGVNDSMVHTDFMIGAPDMMITGWKDGKATPIFENGEWAN